MLRTRQFQLPFLIVFGGCVSTAAVVPEAWRSVPEAASISADQLRRAVAETTPVAPASAPAEAPPNIRVVREEGGARLYRDDTALTPVYADIESFDVSAERGEVVFSARRESNYDAALVAVEGSQVNWIPEDPADEVKPKWASRGNKTAFIVRTRGGDVMRTIHIPTSMQLLVSFPFGRISDFAWDAPAERFAVVWESPDAPQRIELVRYGGEERRIVVGPSTSLGMNVAPFGSGLMLSPASMTYGDRLPLAVWIVPPGDRNRWDDARAALLQDVRSGALIVEGAPDAALLDEIRKTRWIDGERIFVVDAAGIGAKVDGATVITADSSLAPMTYRRRGSVIGVHPAVVKSFAARFIADQSRRRDD